MSNQTWQETLISSASDGAALSNTTTITSILPSQAKFTLPANKLWFVGQMIKVTAQGRISTLVTTPGTLDFDVRLGSVSVAASSAMVLSTTAKTNVTWWLEWLLTVRVVGSAAQLIHVGDFCSEAAGASTVAGEAKAIMIPTSAPAVGTAFDSTAAQLVDLRAHWSVASASNSILCHMYKLELLN